MSTEFNENGIKGEFDDLYFAARRSVKYHEYRQRHFKFWTDFFTFLNIMLGALTLYLVAYADELMLVEYGSMPVKLIPAIIITVLNSIILVYKLNDKAQLHTSLRVQFQKLAVYLKKLEIEDRMDGDAVARGIKRRVKIEVDEPPVLKVLNVICHNETNQSLGYSYGNYKIGRFQKLFAKYFDVGSMTFDKLEPT